MSDLEDLLSLTDIARLAEVGVTAASNWRRRHADFPTARRSADRELFLASDVARWLQKRKISRNDLKPSEVSGATYAQRFLRNLGVPEPSSVTAVTTGEARQLAEWQQRLWSMLDLLRGKYEMPLNIVLIMSLLYLKAREPEAWSELYRDPSSQRVAELLARTRLIPISNERHFSLSRADMEDQRDDPSLIELVNLIDEIYLGNPRSANSVAALISENLLRQLEREMGRRGSHLTPESLARCMVELLNPQSQDLVYDPFCAYGELLAAAASYVERSGGNISAMPTFGQAPSEISWQITKANAGLHAINVDLGPQPSDALEDDFFSGDMFDAILANPPFNMSNWEKQLNFDSAKWPYGAPPGSNANFAWLQHCVSKLAPGGRAAVLMANMTTMTRGTVEATIRQRMVDAGVIDCIVSMPRQLFRSTGIPVSLWLLRTAEDRAASDILFIDAGKMGRMTDRVQRVLTDEDISRIRREYFLWREHSSSREYVDQPAFTRAMTRTEISESGYVLNPRVHIRPAITDTSQEPSLARINELRTGLSDLQEKSFEIRTILNERLASIVSTQTYGSSAIYEITISPLGEICDVLSGPGTVDRDKRRPGWPPLVLPRNIKQNRIADTELDAVDPRTVEKLQRYSLEPGDIVCTRTGTLGRYGLVSTEQAGWLLGPGCIRLRLMDVVNPAYLTYYLGSPSAYAWLMDHATGSAIPHVNTQTLREMPIMLPSLARQDEIATILDALDSEIVVNNDISAATQALRDLLLPLLV